MAGGPYTAYPQAGTQIGVAIEATRGTAPSEPTYMVPVTSGVDYDPMQTYIPDESLQGNAAQIQDEIQGMRMDKHGWSGYPYLDSFPIFVAAQLGSTDTKTVAPTATTLSSAAVAGASSISTAATIAAGSYVAIGSGATIETHATGTPTGTGPYTIPITTPLVYAQASGAAVTGLTAHAFSLLNTGSTWQPPSVSIWDNDMEQVRLLTASQMDELSITGNATKLIDYQCSWLCNPAQNNVTAPTTSYTSTQTPAPWTFTALIGGTETPYVEDWSLKLTRGTKEIPALTGTKEYLGYWADPLQCSMTLTLVEQSGSPYLTQFLNGTKQTFSFTFWDMLNGYACNIYSTSAIYTVGKIDARGKSEWVKVPVTLQFLPTTTDATAGGKSPLKITVANAVTTAYL